MVKFPRAQNGTPRLKPGLHRTGLEVSEGRQTRSHYVRVYRVQAPGSMNKVAWEDRFANRNQRVQGPTHSRVMQGSKYTFSSQTTNFTMTDFKTGTVLPSKSWCRRQLSEREKRWPTNSHGKGGGGGRESK